MLEELRAICDHWQRKYDLLEGMRHDAVWFLEEPKHEPKPAASVRGCCAAMIAPIPIHFARLYDA